MPHPHDVIRPDPHVVLNQLKDFQRNTVEYIFERLYLDEANRNRFLVADEVGLGKTLVARGLVAKVIDHLWDSVSRIDILYICSNADIARQNINRLSIPGLNHFTPTDRITLLPLTVKGTTSRNFKAEKINFVPLTPSTSFDLRSQSGIWKERLLLYKLISRRLTLPLDGAMEVFRGKVSKKNFRHYYLEHYDEWYEIDPSLAEAFITAFMSEKYSKLRERVEALCNLFHLSRRENRLPHYEANQTLISELRKLLATVCMDALEPDLIILDEFQRFKFLLADTNQVGELAQILFKFEKARTVLLSATPYKMYTLNDEADIDDHYQDFLSTMDFLFHDKTTSTIVRDRLTDYRQALYTYATSNNRQLVREQLVEARQALEMHLRRVMVRTEKLAASADRNGLFREVVGKAASLESQDLESYVSLHRISDLLHKYPPLEYWKSSPYLFNFMEQYDIKKAFLQASEVSDPQHTALAQLLAQNKGLLLDHRQITQYQAIDPGNARLRHLLADTVYSGAWRLLWVPPSLPYYQLSYPFNQSGLSGFTKRLVFSAWHVVPKTVASIVSYEVERLIAQQADRELLNTPDARKKLPRLLQFARSEERLTGMPVLAILYPCVTLARIGDSLRFLHQNEGSDLYDEDTILALFAEEIKPLVANLGQEQHEEGIADERWYWLAPLLLDTQESPEATRQWWLQTNLAASWIGEAKDDDSEDSSLWAEHVRLAQNVIQNGDILAELGKQPDDLIPFLALYALAAPGVVALRALSRITGGQESLSTLPLRLSAASVAWAFRSLFNVPEIMLLIRGLYQNKADGVPYWRLVLTYMASGGIQSVLDEYVHVLREALGLLGNDQQAIGIAVAKAVSEAIKLRPASLKIDDYLVNESGSQIESREFRLRTHFALRFGDIKDDDKTLTRKELVRDAFNSPFWPFVVVSTSVGQEGLDFHLYCHAVVHWNLPANAVDLEQREGRVHRYKNHAIRRNLAHLLQKEIIGNGDVTDVWEFLFAQGQRFGTNHLVPFWIFPEKGEPIAYIERHVPILPLSRDADRLTELRRILTVYRMAFGQNRQEDLAKYLLLTLSNEEMADLMRELQINLEPPPYLKGSDLPPRM